VYRNVVFAFVICASTLTWPVLAYAEPEYPIVVEARRWEKLLLLPVRINGKGPFWFVVDSGAYRTVIDHFVLEQTGLRITGKSTVRGTGAGEVQTQHAAGFTMQIGHMVVAVPEPLVIDLGGVPIPKDVHGLVGAEVFESHVVEVDPQRGQFRFFAPDGFIAPPGVASVPLIVKDHRFYLEAELHLADGDSVVHRLRVDTGSQDAIADEIVKRGSNVRETTLGHGLGSNFRGYSGVFAEVRIGPLRFKDVWGPGAPNPAIGMEVFRRFKVTFDVRHGKLYFEPNAHAEEAFPPPPR
jgi:hypothetical protein